MFVPESFWQNIQILNNAFLPFTLAFKLYGYNPSLKTSRQLEQDLEWHNLAKSQSAQKRNPLMCVPESFWQNIQILNSTFLPYTLAIKL